MQTVHCEWGLPGIDRHKRQVAVLVIVDVLSFSTAVDIAVARGAVIRPFPLGDEAAADAASRAAGALLARPRRTAGGQFSLSPASLEPIPPGTHLLLPSPNGARLSLAGGDRAVFAGCLRNAAAVARAALAAAAGRDIAVIPAGERWQDGSLRPAIEDWLGAGAIIAALGIATSPEARLAAISYRAAGPDCAELVRGSVSGMELIDAGFSRDVTLAVQTGTSVAAPRLVGGAYQAG